jgi:nitrate/nitrite transporter NarK
MTRWFLLALAVFQLLIAVLLLLNWDSTVAGFTGKSFAPNQNAAEGAAVGSLGVHVVLAVLYVVVAIYIDRRWARTRATILLAFTIIAGVAAFFAIGDETPLNPVGIALAVIALVLLWGPARKPVVTR